MPSCFGWFGCNKGLCSDAHPFPQVLGLAGRLPAHTQHLHAAPRHLLQCGNGHWHVPRWEGGCREQPGCSPQGWVWTLGPAPGSLLPSVSCPVGGRGRAMVQPERPGDPTLLSRAPGPTEYQLLPAGCLVWGQLPAGAGHHPSRRGARGHPVSWMDFPPPWLALCWQGMAAGGPGRAVPALCRVPQSAVASAAR